MRTLRDLALISLASATAATAACAIDDTETTTPQSVGLEGGLVKMEMSSDVAYLLDDLPAGPIREAAAADIMAKPAQFWIDRATRQVRLTYYRLVFRGLYYSSSWSNSSKNYGPLPLPDKSVWHINLVGTPHRVSAINGQNHDSIVVSYNFNTMIVTDKDSPGKVDPNLGTLGGVADEPFDLPTDPDLLLQRTGYACMDEDEYPAGSVFEENTWYFYDDSCKSGSNFCHITVTPAESCMNSINKHVGDIKTNMHFTRVPYDSTVADQFRVGTVTNRDGADLAVVQKGMEDERRIVYKFFAPGSCELEEKVISKLGWRRLLRFSAIVQNDGAKKVEIGNVLDPNNPWIIGHALEWSACHGHYHFSHYGAFNYDGAPGSKRAFCLEDTNRFHNDESTPLTAEHQSCSFQGIGAGWGDEYEFGIPGQWVDITDVDTTKPHDLTFDSNPDAFLCEGKPVYDANGQPILVPTTFTDAQGNTVSKLACDMPTTWHDNNIGTVAVSSPGGSFVTESCKQGESGAYRDCGFTMQRGLHSCAPGSTVSLTCKNTGSPQVLRICEKSGVLNTGVACTQRDSVSNPTIDGQTRFSFTCPAVRDQDGAGGYSVYTAPVVPAMGSGSVSCTGW